MSIYANQLPGIIPSRPQVTRWRTDWTENQTSNEGDFVTFRIQAWNVVPGQSRLLIWAIGTAYSPSRWLEDWMTTITKACQAEGLVVQRLSSSTYPPVRGTASVRIDVPVGSRWLGTPILCRNRSRINRQNNNGQADGQLLPAKVYNTNPDTPNPLDGSYDTDAVGGTSFFYLNDTSQKPLGTPSYTIQRFDYDGVSPPKLILEPGDGITFRLRTQYIIPGTSFKIYGANTAQSPNQSLEKRIGTYMKEAAKPANTRYEDGTTWPPLPSGWYNGGTLTILEGWDDDSQYFEFKFKVGVSGLPPEGATYQLDLIANVLREGTAADFDSYRPRGDYSTSIAYVRGDWVVNVADGIKYIRLADGVANIPLTNDTYWREYVPVQPSSASFSFSIKSAAPKFWEVRAKRNGANIDYAFTGPISPGARITLSSTNAPAGFIAALEAACAVAGSPLYVDGDTLVVTDQCALLNQSISFSVARGSGTGIHSLTLSDEGGEVVAIREAYAFYNPPAKPNDPTYTVGVNLSTGEFGTDPGVYGTNYIYPSRPEWLSSNPARAHEYMDYIWGLGIRTIRLPFKWGRVQRVAYGPLYGERAEGQAWSGSLDIARIDEIVAYWTGLGGVVLLDVHNFGGTISNGKVRFDKPLQSAGDLPIEGLVDLWVKLANRYKANTKVWFGLMNEPNGTDAYSPTRCRAIFQTVTNAIRGRTQATNKILVPGTEYCSTTRWVANGQAAAYEDFYDPLDNFAFETHLYQDADTAGHSGSCVVNAQNRIIDVTAWARSKGFKLFMGEIAGGNPSVAGQAQCGATTPACYSYMRDNKDVWLGWTTWGYGPWWPPTYYFNLNPDDYLTPSPPKATMQMLIPFISHEVA